MMRCSNLNNKEKTDNGKDKEQANDSEVGDEHDVPEDQGQDPV
jgi:hypothetical protein